VETGCKSTEGYLGGPSLNERLLPSNLTIIEEVGLLRQEGLSLKAIAKRLRVSNKAVYTKSVLAYLSRCPFNPAKNFIRGCPIFSGSRGV
jgi:hypothetical protein